ncbi:M48 family metallopeptidase [Antarcticibacterium arcticum]|uniref:Protease HtpX homolog n=1 Tax=Antarcticibacterium arcticum TaxID=2585771 RepID=A0A5B8YKW8_9FLAO|nr:M48 family metallopeptidase [Antarcticibacterium arcticum]QED38640.1 M48 family metallopeptidase [Antarcticibacterium arcticum]
MAFVGIHTQIRRNNIKSILLLIAFPLLILAAVFAVVYFTSYDQYGNPNPEFAIQAFIQAIPFVTVVVLVWFLIAYFAHGKMISLATGSKPLERKENMRVYNLVENLCMSVGMPMPKVNIIESDALNAFASGLKPKDATVTLTRGIIEKLEDDELEGVIAHELMHIRNRDIRLLVVTVVFVGIFAFVVQIAFRSFLYGNIGGSRRRDKGGGQLMIVILVVAFLAYLISMVFKFALSRKREYMADSGAAEMTRKPWALASALKKISVNHHVKVKSEEVQQMFIENTPKDTSAGLFGGLGRLFSTHPPIEKRIKFLEQF